MIRIALVVLLVTASHLGAAPPQVAALTYSADGKWLAAGGHGEIHLIDVASAKSLHTVAVGPGPVSALAISPDGRRLAVASGQAGKPPELRLVALKDGAPEQGAAVSLKGHKDAVQSLAFNRDGTLLASASYDRSVVLWDLAAKPPAAKFTLKDHSDSVYAASFSPDGKLLATAAADRAVKLWDPATGKRLYTLGDANDWLYALAWQPDGKRLAAAGVDKSIRIWEAGPANGSLKLTGFAHDAPIVRIAFSPDGKTLYSVAEDRTLKSWDAATLAERFVFPRQPETVLALAVRPDGKHLALGRFDGAVIVINSADGKVVAELLPLKPQPPEVDALVPDAASRGRTTRVQLKGKRLDSVTAVKADAGGVVVRIVSNAAGELTADLDVPANVSPGAIQLTLESPAGPEVKKLLIDRFKAIDVRGPNDIGAARKLPLDSTLWGAIERMGDVDYFRFECAAGQQVGVEATMPSGSKLNPALQWLDAGGRVLAFGEFGSLGVVCPKAGMYTLAVSDRDYKGGGDMAYRVHVGTVPVVVGIAPLGVPRGGERAIRVEGVHLAESTANVRAAADAKPGAKLPLPVTSPHGPIVALPAVVVGEFPEPADGQTSLTVPGTANGVIESANAVNEWTFPARKGERLLIETQARRLGSPQDSWIEILTADDKPVERAVLRGVARTVTVLNDRNSEATGFRLEAWNEFAIDDYLLIDQEVVRLRSLPKGPDDDIDCYAVGGRRVAYFGTTPVAHALGSAVYKVAVHPPGSRFSPNGLPLVTLVHRNDDGGPGYGKDSLIVFDPAADGTYKVRVGDSRGQFGKSMAYRLTIRPPKPDFSIALSPGSPKAWRGGGVPLTVTATRIDGFNGPIDVALTGLPAGFRSIPSVIESDQMTTVVGLWCDADAKAPDSSAIGVAGNSVIGGQAVERKADGGKPAIVENGDIVTTVEQRDVILRPGEETTFEVKIERRNGFAGRVPLEVRGLPHGVRVMNIGLNGILVTERDTSRRVVLYAEPWVKPAERPIVVYALHESKKTDHAAGPIMLRIALR